MPGATVVSRDLRPHHDRVGRGKLGRVHVNAIYEILHLIGAVAFVSPMVVFPFVGLTALKAGNAVGATTAARSTLISGLLALTVAAFGSLAVAGADPDRLTFLTPWLLISLVAYLVSVVIAVAVVAPALNRGARDLEHRAPRSIALVGAVLIAVLTMFVTVLMLWRPTG